MGLRVVLKPARLIAALAVAAFCASVALGGPKKTSDRGCAATLREAQFDLEFQAKSKANLEKLRAVYRAAAAAGEPHARFLAQVGFDVNRGIVPSLRKILSAYREGMNQRVREGRIRQEDILQPARVYTDAEKRNWYWVKVGDEPPPGALPHVGALPEARFAAMVADGYFPLGENSKVMGVDHQTDLEHDLSHLGAFLEYPELMPALKRRFRDVRSHPDRYASKNGLYQNDPTSARVYAVIELMTVVPPPERGAVKALLTVAAPKNLDAYTVAYVLGRFPQQSPEELLAKSQVLRTAFATKYLDLGGSSRDMVFMNTVLSRREKIDAPFSEMLNLRGILIELKEAEDAAAAHPRQPFFAQELRRKIARAEVAFVQFSRITPEEWVSEAIRPSGEPRPKLRRIFCDSGIWEGNAVVQHYYCSD